MAVQIYRFCSMNLGRSLERILEEAHISGELKLSNRKLKDFPKSSAKYDLSDTVFADLSRNRFSELPEEITSFAFLETLILYHNAIRSISETIKGLSSLTYLDLRSNQLSSLPREICFLPIQVLLITNNRLMALPDELGRMEKLTELDASCNLLTNLPHRIGDLKNLKSLSLRNNQLVYLPREITTLPLILLNLSSNRISSLPLEIRSMTTLVDLNLENNPLTSPPANLCVRGLVHVFKYLEMQATKDDRLKSCSLNDGYSTIKRISRSANGTLENNKTKKSTVDSMHIINNGLHKLFSQENVPFTSNINPSVLMNVQGSENILSHNLKLPELISDIKNSRKMCGKSVELRQKTGNFEPTVMIPNNSISNGHITDNKPEEKYRNFGNIQTYKEYKEALKQQRNQEIANLYKIKGHKSAADDIHVSSLNYNATQQSLQEQQIVLTEKNNKISIEEHFNANNAVLGNQCVEEIITNNKPVQKVIPSRNISFSTQQDSLNTENNSGLNKSGNKNAICPKYTKPKSPTKSTDLVLMNNEINVNNSNQQTKGSINVKQQTSKSQYRTVNWSQDISAGKLTFTMRREFDKQKEETELIAQLRNIIETKLKMEVPEDISSALTDGVILCHLANHVRPRSVASIHVPSPGVPKLTMARCRRNVDNFLEACRKIGVDEELICSREDVVSTRESKNDNSLSNSSAVFKTVSALIKIIQHQQHQYENQLTPATNKPTIANSSMSVTEVGELFLNCNGALCISVKSNGQNKINNPNADNFKYVVINCNNSIDNNGCSYRYKTDDAHLFDTTNYLIHEEKLHNCQLNATNPMKFNVEKSNNNNDNVAKNMNDKLHVIHKVGTKCIQENNLVLSNCHNSSSIFKHQKDSVIFSICKPHSAILKNNSLEIKQNSTLLTVFLSCVFLITFTLLIIFPIPD